MPDIYLRSPIGPEAFIWGLGFGGTWVLELTLRALHRLQSQGLLLLLPWVSFPALDACYLPAETLRRLPEP